MARLAACALFAASMAALPANAALTISNKPTRHIDCIGGTCMATAANANLNATELANMLDTERVSVEGVQGEDIQIGAAFSWTSDRGLALISHHSVIFNQPVTVAGPGGLSLTTNEQNGVGGVLTFGAKGAVKFWDTSSGLIIGGQHYTLESDIGTLASDIAARPHGDFALANSVNLKGQSFIDAAITTMFTGQLEGLGNTISKLRAETFINGFAGLFENMAGSVENLHLSKARIKGKRFATVGGLAAVCGGTIFNVDVEGQFRVNSAGTVGGLCGTSSGTVAGSHASGIAEGMGSWGHGQPGTKIVGGLVGTETGGSIVNSYSTVQISTGQTWSVGGLVGENHGTVSSSYASGAVFGDANSLVGGLIGSNAGASVADCYASGAVTGAVDTTVGGLIGLNNGAVATSYSSGAVASGSGNAVGGFVGNDAGTPDLTDTYWDITTSGQSHGAGNTTNDPGITGLTTEEFQAGLPAGFDPAIWAEAADVNGGLPYLLALPPG